MDLQEFQDETGHTDEWIADRTKRFDPRGKGVTGRMIRELRSPQNPVWGTGIWNVALIVAATGYVVDFWDILDRVYRNQLWGNAGPPSDPIGDVTTPAPENLGSGSA